MVEKSDYIKSELVSSVIYPYASETERKENELGNKSFGFVTDQSLDEYHRLSGCRGASFMPTGLPAWKGYLNAGKVLACVVDSRIALCLNMGVPVLPLWTSYHGPT
jgi:hypothetical protein